MPPSPPSHGHSAVPVELSPDPVTRAPRRERRDGTDKAGQPCIIFDAIFNPDLCAKAAKDAELRRTIIEISLVRIEQATGFKLGRTIATPNIKSKGPIPPRTARIPAFWASRPSLVQEVNGPVTPMWSWSPTRDGCRIVIKVPDLPPRSTPVVVQLPGSAPTNPKLQMRRLPHPTRLLPQNEPSNPSHFAYPSTRALHETSTLDLEARRLIFSAGPRYQLDTPLLPPAGTKPVSDAKPVGGDKFLPTTVDPDSAIAEWSPKDQEILISIKWASVVEREREKARVV
ncbi:pre-RNA processing PIH1/Nop17 [Ceratobasidium sp. AG-Ba]|nr:pre-RNA processing PIH1/Nop17 [Ceratobasidium sp. AG-Ba]